VFWLYIYCVLTEVFINLTEVCLTLTEVFPCFFLSCKVNARVKLAKTEHRPHFSTLFVNCVVLLLFVFFFVLFVCKCLLPPGDNPIAVNKYIIIATESKPWVYVLSFAAFVDSNPAVGHRCLSVLNVVCCRVSDLCVGLIRYRGEFYRV
jgi:hypothetical protein